VDTADETAGPIQLLYVNADADFTELVRTKLDRSSLDVTVRTATSVDAALAALAEHDVECIATAFSLDDATGIELAASIRDDDDEIPIVLFTGQGDESIAGAATRSGVTDYVPIQSGRDNFELLARRVETLVEARRERAVADRIESRFERTLERTTDAIYAVDSEWRIEYMNAQMADRVGRDQDDLIGTTLWEAFPSVVGTELESRYRTAMETGESTSFEEYLDEPFEYWVEVRAFPDEDGLSVFSNEITGERERQLELERNETILQNVHDVVFVLDETNAVTFANAAAARVLGPPDVDDLEDETFDDVVDGIVPSDADRFGRAIARTLDDAATNEAPGEFDDASLQVALDASPTRTFDVRLTPFRNDGAERVLVVARDVTDQDVAQRKLERERDALRELQGALADASSSVDERLQSVLEVGCRTLDLDAGIVSHVQDDEYTVRSVHAPGMDVDSGDRFDLASTHCETVLDRGGVSGFEDAAAAGKQSRPSHPALELGAYVGAPVVVDGEPYGTVNFSSQSPRSKSFGDLERTFVEILAELVGSELSRCRSRTELERQQFMFDQVQGIADIGLWEYDPETEALLWSDGVRRIHGVDDDYEPTLSGASEFYEADDAEELPNVLERATEDGDAYALDTRLVRADGETRDVSIVAERVTDGERDGHVIRGVIQDITERKDHERENRRVAEEYEALFANSSDAIFLLDVEQSTAGAEFAYRDLSPGYETQTGLTTPDVRGKTPEEVFGEERGRELVENYRRCTNRRAPISYREELAVGDDARFWQTSLAPVFVDDEIVRIVGIARNVTEQVERERELERANRRLESLIESAPLSLLEIGPDGEVLRWNEGAEEMFGWSREAVVGEFNPMVPPDKQDEFDVYRRTVLDGEQIRGKEVRRETKAGDRIDCLLSAAPIRDVDGDVDSVIAVLEDITDQKRMESRLRALQETARDLSSAQSVEEIGQIAVDAAVDILGFELTGVWRYDDGQDALVPMIETAAARDLFGGAPVFQRGEGLAWQTFETDDLNVYDDVRSSNDQYNPQTAVRSEILASLGDNGLLTTGSTTESVFSETDVDLFQLLAATVEAAWERANREAELQRQNERLDEFASVVAHDLRNPLTVSMSFLDLAEETGDSEYFEHVASGHDRIERLIDDLLTLAKGKATIEDAEQVALESVATEAWGYVDTDAATLAVGDALPVVDGDPGRLTQLFENLFRNSVEHGSTSSRPQADDAVEHGGTDVSITVGSLPDDAGFFVADDGVGIPVERRDEVFEHGVTTNEDGTGFGLSIVADIARAHDWTVSVTDAHDGGARFEFASQA